MAAADDPQSLRAALDAAREEARRYRDAYQVLGAAFSESAAAQQAVQARQAAFDGARLVRLHGPQDMVCYDYWASAGADVTVGPAGAAFTTPQQAWHYAAGVPLDFSGVDFARQDCWVRVRLSDIRGQAAVGLYDPAVDAIVVQELLEGADGVREVTLAAAGPNAALLLLRTGQFDAAASGVFVGAEVVTAQKPSEPPPAAEPDGAPDAPSVPRSWRDRLRGAGSRAALALIDRWAPVVERHASGLDRRLLQPLARLAARCRALIGTPRTLWGVSPILTLPLLARCDRLLGLKSSSVVYTTYSTTSAFDVNMKPVWDWLAAHRPQWLDRAQDLFLHLTLLRFDVYHYFCDRGLSPHKRLGLNEPELALIRRGGGRLYAYAYGADVRTRRRTLMLGAHSLCVTCPRPTQLCICDDDRGERNQQMIASYASAMVSMGDMLAYAPVGVRDLHYWPLDTTQVGYVGVDWTPKRPLRVAHAPNHPYFKGTDHLIAAIERLQAEGRLIELVRVQGVPNMEVIRLFQGCDLIADQFVAGFHGYTALEAMLLGKPVLCYLRDPSMALDPGHCPMINTWPESVYQTLKDCLDGRHDLAALGLRSRNYVEHYYSLPAVALRLGDLYLQTAGFPERIRRRIRRRTNALSASLPPLMQGAPPVPWREVPGAHVVRSPAA